MMTLEELLAEKIDWMRTEGDQYTFYAYVQGQRYELTMNDFPQEPLCTLRAEGKYCHSHDFGKHWTLPGQGARAKEPTTHDS